MLKYGENPVTNIGNSKSLVPRNLIYRQKELFKTAVSNSDIISAIQSNSFTIPNAANITSDSADFTSSNVTNLAVDVIRKKTQSLENVTINDTLNVTDLTLTNPQTFSYLFNANGVFESNSLDINSVNLTIADNVVYVNSKFIDDFDTPLKDPKLYDRYLSGFMFPNNNQNPNVAKKKYAGMLVIPAKTYLDEVSFSFKQYDNNKTLYHDNNYVNSVRFTSFGYPFDRNSDTNTMDKTTDNSLKDINACSNLLNIEANNLLLYGGKIVAINKASFEQNDTTNPNKGEISFNVYDSNGNFIELLKLSSSALQVFGPIQIDQNIGIDASGIKFGNNNNIFSIGPKTGGSFVKLDDTNQKVTIMKDTDIFFDNQVRFYKNNRPLPYLTFTDTLLDTSANIRLSVDNPFIQIRNAANFSIIDFNNKTLWRINDIVVDTSANYTFNQQNPFISFQNDTKLTFREGSTGFLTINKTTLESAANIYLTNTNPKITFNDNKSLNFGDISYNYLSINKTSIDVSANISILNNNPKISIPDGKSLNIGDVSYNFVSINNNLIDSSANLKLSNQQPEISFNKTLNISAITEQDISSNPIIVYSIKKNYANYFEKKYLTSISIDANSNKSIYLKDILNSSGENNTFTGKIISRDLDDNIMSMTFNGYSKGIGVNNIVTFFVNHLYTSNPLWTINDILFSNTIDLRIDLNNPLPKDTNWNISLESISI